MARGRAREQLHNGRHWKVVAEGNERPGAVMDTEGGNSAGLPSLLRLFLGGVAVTPRCTHTAAVKAGRGPGPVRRSGAGGGEAEEGP